MTIKEAAIRLGFDVKGNLTNCFNKAAHNNGDKHPSMQLYTHYYKCHACGISGNQTQFVESVLGVDTKSALEWLGETRDDYRPQKKYYKTPTTKPKPVNSEVINYLAKRKISKGTIKRFRLGYLDGSILFPYLKGGKLVNIKYRSISEKKFRKEKDAMSVLWGQDLVTSDRLIICEGEIDAMSMCEYNIDAVSIPSGVNDLSWIENDWDFLQKFNRIYIVMDNDEPGRKAVPELVNRLGKWRCYNVILPYKDVNECLMKGIIKEDMKEILEEAQSYEMDELKNITYFKDTLNNTLLNSHNLEGKPTSNEKMTEILKGWRKRELTIWSGQGGSGKSTFLSQEILQFIENGDKVAIGSFEMPPDVYLVWLGSQHFRQKMHTAKTDMLMSYLNEKLYIIDILGEIGKDNLFEILEFGYRKYGINVFVIDSLMKVSLTSNSQKLYGEQKKFVSSLKDFAMEFNCHIHLVAHSRKGTSDTSVMGKTDVSGSSDITNLADNVIVVHRIQDPVGSYNSTIYIKKNRRYGKLGSVDFLFNEETKRFETINERIENEKRGDVFI